MARIVGTDGDDMLAGTKGDDTLLGLGGDDLLEGLRGNDRLRGGPGEDVLIGGVGADRLEGGAGFDAAVYWFAATGVTADLRDPHRNAGEARGDTYASVERLFGSEHDDVLRGDAADNWLFDYEGNDRVFGRGGSDLIVAGDGRNLFDGGGGVDLLSYFYAPIGVTVRLLSDAFNAGWAHDDRITNIEDLEGTDFGDWLYGDNGPNILYGLGGDDRLVGNGGDDWLVGGRGEDRLDGGDGIDGVSYLWSARGLTVDLADIGANSFEARGDRFRSIEALSGSDFDDDLRGDDGDNTIFGNAGADRLTGRGGIDFLEGGAGRDRLDGGAGIDYAGYSESRSGLTVDLADPGANTGEARGDRFLRIEGLTGTARDDDLRGDDGRNRLFGRDGDDRLMGRGGNDRLGGNDGADLLNGGAGFDLALYEDARDGVTANLNDPGENTGWARGDRYRSIEGLGGSSFDDVLRGDSRDNRIHGDILDFDNGLFPGDNSGNDRLLGGGGDDRLFGMDGADVLRGGGGDDRLDGGAGRDLLSGGSGEDVFVFGTGYGTDRVTDFGDGDRLDLRGLEVAADFDDVMEMSREGPAGLILDFGTDRLVLEGLSTNDLSVDDVLI